MKQLKLMKTLLVAVGLLLGTSAWADDTQYDIYSSESAYVDATDGDTKAATHDGANLTDLIAYYVQVRNWVTAGNTCNAKFNAGGKMALYKFPLSSIKSAEGIIKSATVKITVNSTGDNKNCTKFGVFGYNGSQDWTGASLTYNTLENTGANALGYTVDYTGSFPILDENNHEITGGSGSVLSVGATTYLQSAMDDNRDYISFVVSNNSTRVANLNVTAKLEVVYTSDIPFSYTINAVDGASNVLKTYADNLTGYVGNTYRVYYNKCVESNGVWYETNTKNSEPYLGVDVTAGGTTNITYAPNGAKYYYEFESLPTARSNGSGGTGEGNAPARYSNGSAKRLYQYTRAYTPALSGGFYTIRLKAHNISSSSSTNATLYLSDASGNINGEQIATFSDEWPKATLDEKSISDIYIPEGSSLAIYNNSGNNSNLCIDYFILTLDAEKTAIYNAILDCKTYDTSDAFATAIDAESFANAAAVYAFNTSYHITNGVLTDGIRNITGVIRNAAVNDADATDWDGASTYYRAEEQYTGAPDHYVLDRYNGQMWATQTIYSLPAGVYVVKANTRGGTDSYSHVYVSNGTSDLLQLVTSALGDGAEAGTLGNGWSTQQGTFTLTETTNIILGFYADGRDKKWASCDDWHLYKVESVSAPITSSTGYATFSSTHALDFSEVTGLTAYTATACDGTNVTLSPVFGTVAANTGLVIKGETTDIPVVATGDTQDGNMLFALDGSYTELGAGTGGTNYVLSVQNDKAVFAPIGTTPAPVTAGHAALFVPNGSARTLNIVFDDDATGINAVSTTKAETGNYYNLAGQRVAQPTKGLYIVNGKKYVVK